MLPLDVARRLLLAAVLGAAIGLEREYRAGFTDRDDRTPLDR